MLPKLPQVIIKRLIHDASFSLKLMYMLAMHVCLYFVSCMSNELIIIKEWIKLIESINMQVDIHRCSQASGRGSSTKGAHHVYCLYREELWKLDISVLI